MPRESVGDVLRKAHRWLRVGGTLVNLQPFSKPMEIDVRLAGERRPVGIARDCPDKIVDMQASLREVAEAVRNGLFALRGELQWLFEFEFHSEEDWAEFRDKPNCGGVEADLASLHVALSRADGCIITVEENVAAAYERLS